MACKLIFAYKPSVLQMQVSQLVRDYLGLPQDLLEKTLFRREPKLTAVQWRHSKYLV